MVDEFLKQENNPADMVSSSNFYYTKGAYNGEAWQTLLDSSTGKLWVTINYRN